MKKAIFSVLIIFAINAAIVFRSKQSDNINLFFSVAGRGVFAFGPPFLFAFIYYRNKQLLEYLETGKPIPKKLMQGYNQGYIDNLKLEQLRITGTAGLVGIILWLLFVIFIIFREHSTFLVFP